MPRPCQSVVGGADKNTKVVFESQDRVRMQNLCDIGTMRVGVHIKPSNIVAPSPIHLPHDEIATMDSMQKLTY